MACTPVPLVFLALVGSAARLHAQAEPWLAEVPTAERVVTVLQTPGSRAGPIRAAAALYSFTNLVQSLTGSGKPSAAATARVAELDAGMDRVASPEYARDGNTYRFESCKQVFSDSPEFHRELLDKFFTAQWIAAWGSKLDPRRWKAPLALPAGTRLTTWPAECGTMPVVSAAAPVAAAAPAKRASTLLEEGTKHHEAKRYKEARTAFGAAVKREPGNARALYLLAMSELEDDSLENNFEVSESTLRRALALEPKDAALLTDIGDALYIVGIDYAEKPYLMALDLKPPADLAARGHAGLGWVYYFYTFWKNAADEFRQAIRLAPPNLDAMNGLGSAYAKAGMIAEARGIHRQMLQIDRDRATKLLAFINETMKKP